MIVKKQLHCTILSCGKHQNALIAPLQEGDPLATYYKIISRYKEIRNELKVPMK